MGCVPPVIAFLLVALSAPACASARARLSGDVVPVAYDLSVSLDVVASRFVGTETLDVSVRRPVHAIVLNARRLSVGDATIDGRNAHVSSIAMVEQLELRSAAPLEPGRHRIELTFSGEIGHGDPSGLSKPPNEHGPFVTTLFEPSSARAMFPCFDEPEFRASFSLHVAAPRDWTVVSNMPLRARRDDGGGLVWNDFEKTPPMPAYTLILDGGNFVHVDGAAGRVPIRVFVRPGEEKHARTILADAERVLPFYETFFGMPFPLPKLDIVVNPGALQSAFEGWGAITFYSEANVFGSQFGGGEAGRRYAVEILAHEMAHQWFGDLVTMRWWRDTFVAEAVAQFSQRAATRAVFPELRTWLDDDLQVATVMQAGVTAGTGAVLAPIATDLDRDDWNAFGQATYDKGASTIAGWRDVAGASALHDGLVRYLRGHAYGSATFEDFWRALGGSTAVSYGHSWLTQRGFPIVDVRAACIAGATAITVSQEPFVVDRSIGAAYRSQRWEVPLVLRVGLHVRRVIVSARRTFIRVSGCGAVAVDPDERPYYFVRYDNATFARLAKGASPAEERQRERLLRDATMLHAVGALHDVPYLRVLASAREPLDASVWVILAQEYRRMDVVLRDAPEAHLLIAMQRASLEAFVLRYDRIDSSEAGPFRLGYDSADALAASGDPIDGAPFHNDYGRLLDGATPTNFESPWLVARLAAADATPDDVRRSEARLRERQPDPGYFPFEEAFLENVGDEALARRVLSDAMADRHFTSDDPRAFLFAFGNRHPQLAFAYLSSHLRGLVRDVPPTQQAWIVSNGVASSLWEAAPPPVLERFLRTSFPAERATVDTAIARIERSWSERRALRRALREIASEPPAGPKVRSGGSREAGGPGA